MSHPEEDRTEEALQYGEDQGSERMRQAIVTLRTKIDDDEDSAASSTITTENILITNGSSQGLDLICLRFSKPGDIILVERLTYFYIDSILEQHGLVTMQVPHYKDVVSEETTGSLMDPDALEKTLIERQKKGLPMPKLLYIVPICQNPTGATMEEAQARELIDIARRFNFKIVSDEVYLFLAFNCETPPRSLLDYDEDKSPSVVLALNSFSKILGPGLRLGWIESSPNNIKYLEQTGYIQSGGGLNPFASSIVANYIGSGKQAALIQQLNAAYQRRCRVMTDALELSFGAMPVTVEQILKPVVPNTCYVRVTGGFFLWLRFPTHWNINTKDFLEVCLQRDDPVSFFAGHNFSLGTPLLDDDESSSSSASSSWWTDNAIRICFAYLNEEDIANAIGRLAMAAYEAAENLGKRG